MLLPQELLLFMNPTTELVIEAGYDPTKVTASGYAVPTTAGAIKAIAHPMPGYRGQLVIVLAGQANQLDTQTTTDTTDSNGVVTSTPNGDAILTASGEVSAFQYTCLGDEQGFQLKNNTTSTAVWGQLEFSIVGGVNDGKFCCVSSCGPVQSSPSGTRVNNSNSVFGRYIPTFGGAWGNVNTYGNPSKTLSYTVQTGSLNLIGYGTTSNGGLNQPYVSPSTLGAGNTGGYVNGGPGTAGGCVLLLMNNS